MAGGLVNFKINQGSLRRIKGFISKLAKRRFRDNFADLQSVAEKAATEAIMRNSTKFIPNNREAAELGVGVAGSIRLDKTYEAWKLLLPSHAAKITVIKSIKTGSSAGQISIDIDKPKFFNSRETNVSIISPALRNIPWMEWFLEGAEIQGARFSDRQPIPATSRTGRGIMIRGGLWRFRPQPEKLTSTLADINRTVAKAIKVRGAIILSKVIR